MFSFKFRCQRSDFTGKLWIKSCFSMILSSFHLFPASCCLTFYNPVARTGALALGALPEPQNWKHVRSTSYRLDIGVQSIPVWSREKMSSDVIHMNSIEVSWFHAFFSGYSFAVWLAGMKLSLLCVLMQRHGISRKFEESCPSSLGPWVRVRCQILNMPPLLNFYRHWNCRTWFREVCGSMFVSHCVTHCQCTKSRFDCQPLTLVEPSIKHVGDAMDPWWKNAEIFRRYLTKVITAYLWYPYQYGIDKLCIMMCS